MVAAADYTDYNKFAKDHPEIIQGMGVANSISDNVQSILNGIKTVKGLGGAVSDVGYELAGGKKLVDRIEEVAKYKGRSRGRRGR